MGDYKEYTEKFVLKFEKIISWNDKNCPPFLEKYKRKKEPNTISKYANYGRLLLGQNFNKEDFDGELITYVHNEEKNTTNFVGYKLVYIGK